MTRTFLLTSAPWRRTAARLVATLGALLLATGLLVVGAVGGASADDKVKDKPGAPGNNGTVKVGDATDLDEQRPENDPHLPCTFNIQWFNYDSGHGPITSTVTFELQPPTDSKNGVSMSLASGSTSQTFVGNGGQPGAGGGRDHLAWYTLAFTGPAQPQQGYHVKITVNTPHSQGNDVKHKVFWVGPCEAPSPSNPVTSPSQPVTTASNPVTTPSNPVTSPSQPASAPAGPGGASSAAAPAPGGGVVAGTQTSRPKPGKQPGNQPGKQPPAQVLGTQAVAPTAVAAGDAGTPGSGPSGGLWAVLLIGSGLALVAGGGALGLRGPRGTHQA